MRFSRVLPALVALSVLNGCGYVHFGRLPVATPTGDGAAYSNLLTEHKILQQELVLARKEGDALRAALDRCAGGGSPELTSRLNETTRELATLRASYAKLQAERSAAAAPASNLQLAELQHKLATSERNAAQLQTQNAELRAEVDRARAENATLTSQLKSAAEQNTQAQSALTQLNGELLAQKEARSRVEQANAALTTQLGAVLAARDAAASSSAPNPAAPASQPPPAPASALQLTKAPPADSSAVAELRTNLERLRNTETAPAPAAAPATRKHVVQAGDTLEKIAQKYYGDSKRWIKIYTANNDLLRDGRPLKAGMELEIPEN